MGTILQKAIRLILEGRYRELFAKSLHRLSLMPYYLWKRPLLYKQMRQDTRFTISDSLLKMILSSPVKKYTIENIRLGSIKRRWNEQIMNLTDTATFAYIVHGDEKIYREYVRTVYEKILHMDENIISDNIEKNIAGVHKTIETLAHEGYDIHRGAVVVDEENIIIDGLHRSSILYKQYGSDYEIPVLRIYHEK